MWTDGVVFLEPSLSLVPHLFQVGEDPGVKDTITVAAVETFDERVMGRLPDWMNSSSIPWLMHQAAKTALVNSGP